MRILLTVAIAMYLLVPPIAANAADISDVDAVPYISENGRTLYRDEFLKAKGHRVFVVSPMGQSAWRRVGAFGNVEELKSRALYDCVKVSSTPCFIYALDDAVVWDGPAPDELRRVETANVGVSLNLPERWTPACNAWTYVTESMYGFLCGYRDSKNAAVIGLRVRARGSDLRSFADNVITSHLSLYAADKGRPFPHYETASKEVALTLPNGTPATVVHKTYVINQVHYRNVAYLFFEHGDFQVAVTIANAGGPFGLEGEELDRIVAALRLS